MHSPVGYGQPSDFIPSLSQCRALNRGVTWPEFPYEKSTLAAAWRGWQQKQGGKWGGMQRGTTRGGNPTGASRGRPVCCELCNLAENAAFCQGSGVREGITTAWFGENPEVPTGGRRAEERRRDGGGHSRQRERTSKGAERCPLRLLSKNALSLVLPDLIRVD